jgi:hypothetical protein
MDGAPTNFGETGATGVAIGETIAEATDGLIQFLIGQLDGACRMLWQQSLLCGAQALAILCVFPGAHNVYIAHLLNSS